MSSNGNVEGTVSSFLPRIALRRVKSVDVDYPHAVPSESEAHALAAPTTETAMAHLSERHELAKRRRDELIRERSLSLALRTGYPETFHESSHTPRRLDTRLDGATAAVIAETDKRKYTAEELAAARLRCEERVRTARERASRERRRLKNQQQHGNEQQPALDAAAMAAQRLRDRKEKDRRLEEEEVDVLISQQTSSIKAMNIARMLSPRFEERVVFTPAITKNSVEDGRVVQLLTNSRVGTFYQ